eukprot:767978-Hanusia_phi.AAC.2
MHRHSPATARMCLKELPSLLVFDLFNKQVVLPDTFYGSLPSPRDGYAMTSVNSTIVLHGGNSNEGSFLKQLLDSSSRAKFGFFD